MKDKKGFTLIEVISVVLIIGLLTIFIIPKVINQIGDKSNEVDKITEEIIFGATKLYIDDNDLYKVNGCYNDITLNTLIKKGYLDSNSLKYTSGKDIPINSSIEVTKDINGYSYELGGECN